MADTPGRQRIKTTCPRDCYDACGMVAVKDDGVLRKILGDPDHPVAKGALCGKCAIVYNGVFRDPDMRLRTPLKRVGAKGRAWFEEIGWDEALDIIAGRLGALVDRKRGASILHTHYTGTVALISGWFPIRFFQAIGATEVDPDTVCNKAGHLTLQQMFGDSLEGFDPRGAKDAKVILVWGANPSHSAPHQDKHWLAKSGALRIVVDPIAHKTAQAADLHLKLRPGTDAALAFAFMHVAERDGLLDEAFIAAHTLGFDGIRQAIAQATPDWAEAMTGVPKADIETAARAYAAGPSLLWMGQGLQRQKTGGNVFRSLGALVAATGNLGRPGTGFCYMNGPANRGVDMGLLTPPGIGESGSISHMDLAATLADPERASALVCWNNNIAASSPQQAELRRSLSREDLFVVCVDLFHTDTTAYADIVLPAASFLEFDDLVAPYFDLTLSAQVKVMEPLGQSLPNQEIFRRLAARMNLAHPALYETDEEILSRVLAGTPFQGSFQDLARVGTVPAFPETRIQFADGIFATPSGRIEIACQALADMGAPLHPLPLADAPAPGKLRILSPASAWQMNSSYGNDPKILDHLGQPTILVHPDDLAARAIEDGQTVEITSRAGRLRLKAVASPIAQPGMGIVYKGRWPNRDVNGANVNTLFAGEKTDIGESSAVHSTEAEMVAVLEMAS